MAMILSDLTLKELIKKDELSIDPFDPSALQPASLDCRLGTHFLILDEAKTGILTMDSEIHYTEYEGDSIVMQPKSFLLATTVEYFKLPVNLSAFVEGRSSIGRMGLFIQNAGWVDAGFEGRITLELYNANSLPIKLMAGRRICQMVFCRMDQAPSRSYNGKYQGQTKSVGSRIFQDTEIRL